MPLSVRATLLWLAIMPLAVINGFVRQFVFRPSIGDLAAHHVSTVILAIVIFGVAYYGFGVVRASRCNWLYVGFGWLLATVAFEFLAGHFLFGNSWQRLLADYNLCAGRIWVVILLVLSFAPIGAAKLRGRIR